jgi:hypothetical protein
MARVIVLPPTDSPIVIGMGCGKRNADSNGEIERNGFLCSLMCVGVNSELVSRKMERRSGEFLGEK